MAVEALPLHLLDAARPGPPVDSGYPLLLRGSAEADAAQVGMHHVGIDAALHHRAGQVDPLGGEVLDEGFGDDTAAHVACGWAGGGEVARLVGVDCDVNAG